MVLSDFFLRINKSLLLLLFLTVKLSFTQNATIASLFDRDSVNRFDYKGKQGVWVVYDTIDSVVLSMHHFINDTLQGYFECYYYSGQISEKGYYKNGLLDSVLIVYWRDYVVNLNFNEGKLNGVISALKNGNQIVYRLKYNNDSLDTNYEFKVYNRDLMSDYVDQWYIKSKLERYVENSFRFITALMINISKNRTLYKIYKNDLLFEEYYFNNNKIYYQLMYKDGIIKEKYVYFKNMDRIRESYSYYENPVLDCNCLPFEKCWDYRKYNRRGKLIKEKKYEIK